MSAVACGVAPAYYSSVSEPFAFKRRVHNADTVTTCQLVGGQASSREGGE